MFINQQMKKFTTILAFALLFTTTANAQTTNKRIYDENINPLEQIDKAIKQAKDENKYVACQVGGNWCPWCLRFADFITNDSSIDSLVTNNYIYIHVNYNPRKSLGETQQKIGKQLMTRLHNPDRFGFPVIVILDENGNVLHTQDSSFLEEGKGYNKEKVIRFFKNWTPTAANTKNK